ncbi:MULTISPECIES: ATP-binding protein [unclassified Pseudomonas]|jgi:signal transduction histidine kinase|uniref:ATP-binding protein n=1 Tax=unclassified Pseudomonas TaxID=196821 RepID=UPI000C86909A|nr:MULTISPECIES: ATP-binding protein [unclassified Pseudomonas]PMV26079.1 hybrid sensor histidine kinase/response regulator [Pseudomonas sp. FW305-3-2-15-C-TSA2]PMV31299.1 hybrid sensor histidine kinase/response regulator [Pseudomonas sp. DP16D-L5]PMV41825.1 hybrid sensor histidine kinase/response regulator [Pseudomonas sp. FW305-3-2-15-A-LB2]PMV42016.1 hybrid sensor histidine kinase/response regulator [Pseudomonas sp. FW305-3-2-15-C-R2A1]PMV53971.1 hybrid sensor histidine kinase/response regu
MNQPPNRRILLIDDTPSIHDDFRKILMPAVESNQALDDMESALFGDTAKAQAQVFELHSAYGGEEGLQLLVTAMANKQPYALAFVDMRMPQGWDGAKTIEELWKVAPDLQVVVCTAYSDYSWEDLLERLHAHDRLLILKKPFDNIEVQQMANTLANKWDMARRASLQTAHLEQLVEQRTQALQLEIDERKHLESQLVQSEKLASLGQLAAGVAHEINNPVGFISSNLSTLDGYFNQLQQMLDAYRTVEQTLAPGTQRDQLKAMRDEVELDFLKEDIPILIRESKEGISRVIQIVKDLKNFSRVDNDQTWQFANLQQGIDSTLNIVASELKYKADVVKHYAPLPEIECLASQLNQVVMNLVINAAQAMGPERGTITISNGVEGEHVWLEVADNGCGIAPETVQKIFDPFFTTKPVGEGTGLGLSLSYGIVKKHRGDISVSSELGKGTKFRVVLPIRQTAA